MEMPYTGDRHNVESPTKHKLESHIFEFFNQLVITSNWHIEDSSHYLEFSHFKVGPQLQHKILIFSTFYTHCLLMLTSEPVFVGYSKVLKW